MTVGKLKELLAYHADNTIVAMQGEHNLTEYDCVYSPLRIRECRAIMLDNTMVLTDDNVNFKTKFLVRAETCVVLTTEAEECE